MYKKIIGMTLLTLALVVGATLVVAAQENEGPWTREYTFEVMQVEGSTVVAKMPDGLLRTFTVAPDREFVVDGKTITVKDLKAGTSLTATITSKPAPEAIDSVSGRLMWRTGRTVVVKLDSGEIKQFTVSADFQFTVDGKEVNVHELTKGTHLTSTWITEDPETVVTPDTPLIGKGPS